MTDQETKAAFEPPLDCRVRALVSKWTEDNHVLTVNRSYGEQTTAPVSMSALESLVRAAMLAEREACAELMERQHTWITSAAASSLIRGRSNA